MHGSVGVRACQARGTLSLRHIALIYQVRFFGEKLHMDQNEKCVMFGVTHVVAVDGYSPPKKTILIYFFGLYY